MSLGNRFAPIILLVLMTPLSSVWLYRFAERAIPYQGSNGCAVLSFDAAYNDREIARRLETSAAGAGYISESGQTVFLDNFGELEAIPLDRWAGRLEDFDPRRDGFAEKLSAFFVRDGKRLFFIPITEELDTLGAEGLRANVAAALGDIPFEVEFLGYDQPVSFYQLLFAGAALLAVLISRSRWITLTIMPLTAGFAFMGSPGFALIGMLLVMIGAATGQLRDFFASRRYGDTKTTVLARINTSFHHIRRTRMQVRIPRLKPLGFLLSVILFLTAAALYAYIGRRYDAPSGFLAAAAVCVCAALPFVLWAESNRGRAQDHIRFTPVPLTGSAGVPVFTRAVIPFALAAYAALVLPGKLELVSYRESDFLGESAYLIKESDYEKHVVFQQTFSFTPLGEETRDGVYERYVLGEDGLVTGAAGVETGSAAMSGNGMIPPFKLQGLMDFLRNSGDTEKAVSDGSVNARDMLPIAPLILPCLLALFNIGERYRKKNMSVYHEKWNLFRKRIAA
jgi:hypothetical protein